MPITRTGVRLLSALRKQGSASLLFEIPDAYFTEDEQKVFSWLKRHVRRHRAFPSVRAMREATGVRLKKTNDAVSYYAEECRKRSLYNQMLDPFSQFRASMEDRDPDNAVEVARQIINLSNSHMLSGGNRGLTSLDAAMDEVVSDYDIAHDTYGLRGITTGWPEVDAAMDGHQNGDLNVLVGRPGRGKTNLLLWQAHAAWAAGRSVLFVSMEMTGLQIARRLVGIESGINPRRIKTGRLSTRVKADFDAAVTALRGGVPFNLVVGNFRKSVSMVRALAEEQLPDIIYIDAGYLLAPEKRRKGSESRREMVSDVIEEQKMLATDLNRPVVPSVQLNRSAVPPKKVDREQENRNPLAHLGLEKIAETDVVGQVASCVTAVEYGDPPHEASRRWYGFLKGREGEMGYWEMQYQFNPVRFSIIRDNPDEERQQDERADLNWVED